MSVPSRSWEEALIALGEPAEDLGSGGEPGANSRKRPPTANGTR